MGKDKVDSGKCSLGVCGVAEFNVRRIFLQIDFAGFCNDLLTLCMDLPFLEIPCVPTPLK